MKTFSYEGKSSIQRVWHIWWKDIIQKVYAHRGSYLVLEKLSNCMVEILLINDDLKCFK